MVRSVQTEDRTRTNWELYTPAYGGGGLLADLPRAWSFGVRRSCVSLRRNRVAADSY